MEIGDTGLRIDLIVLKRTIKLILFVSICPLPIIPALAYFCFFETPSEFSLGNFIFGCFFWFITTLPFCFIAANCDDLFEKDDGSIF